MANVKRKAIKIKITNDKGQLTVETPFYKIVGFTLKDLNLITVPFAGISVDFAIECKDKLLRGKVLQELDRQSTWGFYLKSEPQGVRNYIFNAMTKKMQVYTVDSLKGVGHDRPLLYLGAGPSLGDNLDRVREIIEKKQAIVIAGGSAIRILAANDIKPHYALAIDPYEFEWSRVFEHIDPKWTKDVPLLTSLVLETKCFDMWQGEIYVGGGCNCFSPRDAMDGLQTIKEGQGGVSTTILHWASYMGFKDITMLGTDLCYKVEDDKLIQYADGRTEDTDEQGPLTCPTSGRVTRSLWMREALFISDTIKEVGIKVYNASNGLHIEGTTETTLDRYTEPVHHIIYKMPEQLSVHQKDIEQKLLIFARELINILHHGVRSPEAMKLGAYQSYLKTYDYLQQMRELWTYSYNTDLIENLAYNCIDWVRQAIHLKGEDK